MGESPCGFDSHLRHHPQSGRRRTWSDDQLAEAVPRCFSIRSVLQVLNLHPTGANYQWMHRAFARLQLDTSHFTGQGHLRGRTHGWSRQMPLDQILVEDSDYLSLRCLKKRLLATGLLQEYCALCSLVEWQGHRLSLVLDHINGNPRDHSLSNLRLLCPNCNSQTPTFAGRNKRRDRFRVHVGATDPHPTR